jgi:hypothetical protein
MAATASRWLNEANADAALKFAPTKTALAEALREAKETYGTTVREGNSTATLSEQAAKNAEPAIHQVYAGATAAEQGGQASEAAQLAALPGVANTYKAEADAEAQTHLSNLLGAKSRDEAMLHQSGVAAREGAQFNQLNASQALQKTLTGLFAKSSTASQEQGDFAATTAEKLANEAEKLEQKEKASVRSSTTSENDNKRSTATSEANNVRTNKREEAASANAAGVKPVSTAEMDKASSEILAMRGLATGYAKKGLSRGQILAELTQGAPSQSIAVNGAGKPVGAGEKAVNHLKTSAIPAYKPNVLMSAALDEALFGFTRSETKQRLERAGYNFEAMGLHAEPKGAGQAAGKVASGAAQIGKTIQHALGG